MKKTTEFFTNTIYYKLSILRNTTNPIRSTMNENRISLSGVPYNRRLLKSLSCAN